MRQKAFSLLIGLFIGSLPYLFLPLVWLFSSRDPNAVTAWVLEPVRLLFFFWPFIFICQCVAAFSSLFAGNLRQRLIAGGILIMLALMLVALFLGWLPPPSSISH